MMKVKKKETKKDLERLGEGMSMRRETCLVSGLHF